MNPLPNPQVAAVHQTLAGERLTCQVQFPMTGDVDCDFIQGVLAVKAAIGDMWPPGRAVIILRYLAERFAAIEENQSQPPQPDWQLAIQQAVRAELLRHTQPSTSPPWYTPSGSPLSGLPAGSGVGSAGRQITASERAVMHAADYQQLDKGRP